jgi:hypothetical protein
VELTELLKRVISILEGKDITYMVVGSVATIGYGNYRLTADVDIVVALTADQADALCDSFPMPDFYVSREAAREAARMHRQFNVIHPASGFKIDFMMARSDAWGKSQLARRQRIQIMPGVPGYVAAPEDIIISKMRYYKEGGSEKHLSDIAGIMKESSGQVDRSYVEHWAQELGLQKIWEAIQKRLSEGPSIP